MVPFPPGGGNDALARAVAERMSKTLGQQVVVDNRGGAGGTVATRAAAKNAPDGYTILLAYTGTLAINPSLYPNVGYDPRKDFAPIGLIAAAVQRAGRASLAAGPFGRRDDRVRQGQSAQDRLCVRARHGRPYHDRAVRQDRGIHITRIPYKGNGPAMADLVGGHVSMMFLSILPVLGHVERRHVARAGGDESGALEAAARRADHRGIRTVRIFGRHSLWAGGAGGHAARASSIG